MAREDHANNVNVNPMSSDVPLDLMSFFSWRTQGNVKGKIMNLYMWILLFLEMQLLFFLSANEITSFFFFLETFNKYLKKKIHFLIWFHAIRSFNMLFITVKLRHVYECQPTSTSVPLKTVDSLQPLLRLSVRRASEPISFFLGKALASGYL